MRRGLVSSRERARLAIEEGRVLVGGAPAARAARLVGPGEPLRLIGPGPRFVSRGGEKLDAALDQFDIAVTGGRVIDAGSSTGGFTDCVLQRGAAHVVAVDVGRGQLHERLRNDPRVSVHERTNLRTLDVDAVGGVADLVVADLSFISLRTVADKLIEACRPGGDLVVLVKPQFEAGRVEASRGHGVITDPATWRRTVLAVGDALGQRGAAIMGVMMSPLRGAEGNVEFLLHAIPGEEPSGTATLIGLVDPVIQAAVDVVRAGLPATRSV